ncbi:hypothetical protein PR202_gb10035 [Eleusine coracana subsp. coracana]|uniref:Uncharacterized protein n=1 Tax=Eleusine coracana subsp. coracana TaxID=191504 RepID=A0AAV5EI50_ELECO|nr:hypothetical protein PR202_gb10035 [Eleusine coracana subsp. coracana]
MEPASSSSTPPAAEAAAWRRPPEELKLRRKTLETVLEQCQRALEMMREEDGLVEPADAVDPPEDKGREADGDGRDDEGAQPPPPSDADYETDEVLMSSVIFQLCDLLQSRVQSPEFLEKLDSIQKSVYQHGAVDETISWDIASVADIWDDKSMNVSDDSEDGYVLVKQEDIVDGIACFMAAYLLSLKQTKDLTPNQLQQALSKTFSAKKRKSKLQKAWDGTKVVYNIASWSATAIG